MIPKPLDHITEADLQALISDAVPEGRTIEYKRALPGNSEKGIPRRHLVVREHVGRRPDLRYGRERR
jgi:hypothetical protein